jgi:hypothetical protein
VWNTTRDNFSKPARNDFPNMPPLTGLEIPWRLVFYKYFAPLALGTQSYLFFASMLAKRLSMLLKGKFTFPLGCRIWRK